MTPPDATSTRRAAVVYNPIKVDEPHLRAVVAAAEADAGWGETLWFETSVEDPGADVTRQAVEAGAAVVMAAGGDGTVRSVAEGLRGTGVPIGLLPQGTGNLLARNLSLDLNHLEGSVASAFTGKDREIDLGVANAEFPDGTRRTDVFLVMAGMGLDAKMIANARPELKKRVGWLAYVDAIGRALWDRNRIRLRYRLDGADAHTMRVNTILVGNCGSLPGNILLLPEAAVDDGVFDIVALRPEGFIGWIQITVKVLWENGVLRRTEAGRRFLAKNGREVRTLRYMKGRELVVRLDEPQEYELDGDAFGEVVALKCTVDPGGLVVRIPQDEEIDTTADQQDAA